MVSISNNGKGSSLGLVGKACGMTLALLLVGACIEAWWTDGTNYSISLNYICIAS